MISAVYRISINCARQRVRACTAVRPFALLLVMAIAAILPAQAQTFSVIHNFTSGAEGWTPNAGVTIDAAGNLYGTTSSGGGNASCGAVFELKHSGSGWVSMPLYSFAGGNDGCIPFGRVTIAAGGGLYGTTYWGGGNGCSGMGCGTVFYLRPSPRAPRSALAPWRETVLHSFSGVTDGANPSGDLIFDSSRNIYGTTEFGAGSNNGVIYELSPSGNGWIETVLYTALNFDGGAEPQGGVAFDSDGNLYGVFAEHGPYGYGATYELSPSGLTWTEQAIHGFTNGSDGRIPLGGLIIDAAGSLYGTTSNGGSGGGGVAFELTPSGSGWTFESLYAFQQPYQCGSLDKLAMDGAGNLYGTSFNGGRFGWGAVFKLTSLNGVWTYTAIHDFTGGSDGLGPRSNLVFDASGNLYGTTTAGGSGNNGVVFEIMP